MTIRVKLRGDKAIIRFGNNMEEGWFRNMLRSVRDSDPKTHPKISLMDAGGELPKLKVDKGEPISLPQKLTPEMVKKMEIQQPMKVLPIVKGKPIKMETNK